MDEMPDYSRYTLAELHDVHDHIDRERYPDRFKTVLEQIRLKEAGVPQPEAQDQTITNAPGTELPVIFSGSADEYFRIWIVNLCLTILTLGIFSAWAKVRKKRYFYSRTTLDGTPFQYLGQPIPILKGRIVAGLAFLSYYVSTHFVTSLLPYVLAAGSVLAPWMIVRSAAFNARYSAFRNMTFRFDAKYLDALNALYAWALIPVLMIGALYDWWGNSPLLAVPVLVFGCAIPWLIRRFKGFIIQYTSFGGKHGTFNATGGQFLGLYLKAGAILVAAVMVTGIFSAFLFASMKHLSVNAFNAVWLLLIPLYLGYALAYAYYQANSVNLVWNHTRLGPVRFHSTLSGRGLAKLYVTNALAIICTLGLLIPWAVVRTLKYRAEHTRVVNEGDLADFSGSELTSVQAIGAETMDFFEMDISL